MNDHTTHLPTNEIPYGYCRCGCGQKTKIAERTSTRKGWIKGEPQPFVRNHKGTRSPRTTTEKQCTSCKNFKPMTTEYFFACSDSRDGFKAQCKECLIAKQEAFRSENADRIRSRQNELNAQNREKLREQNRLRYAKQKDIANKRTRNYKARNKTKISEYNRKYKETHRESLRANEARRNARKRQANGNHTAADIKRQYDLQKGKCYWCEISVGDVYEVDHIIPLSRGGSNGPENIAIACPSCNVRKSNKLPTEWEGSRRLL